MKRLLGILLAAAVSAPVMASSIACSTPDQSVKYLASWHDGGPGLMRSDEWFVNGQKVPTTTLWGFDENTRVAVGQPWKEGKQAKPEWEHTLYTIEATLTPEGSERPSFHGYVFCHSVSYVGIPIP